MGDAMTMTGTDVANIVTALGVLFTAIASIWNGIQMKRARKAQEEAAEKATLQRAEQSRQIDEVHKTTNSKMDAMLDLATKAAKAEGKEEGRVERVAVDAALAKVEADKSVAFDQGKQESVIASAVEGNVAEKRLATAAEKMLPEEKK